jgi:hypothetical protein
MAEIPEVLSFRNNVQSSLLRIAKSSSLSWPPNFGNHWPERVKGQSVQFAGIVSDGNSQTIASSCAAAKVANSSALTSR